MALSAEAPSSSKSTAAGQGAGQPFLPPSAGPIVVHVSGPKAYVWDPISALRLRMEHRIMGCLIGGVAQFKNQNDVNSLPLELNQDEVTLAVEKGWAVLAPSSIGQQLAFAVKLPTASGPGPASKRPRRQHGRPDWAAYQLYYQMYDERRDAFSLPPGWLEACQEADTAAAQHADRQADQPAQPAPAAAAAAAGPDASEPLWQAALSDASVSYSVPLTAHEAERQRQRVGSASGEGPGGAHGTAQGSSAGSGESAAGPVQWPYPSTAQERLRYAVFRDLHSQGFMLTGGAKFGADMLAYPGDPSLYHAQFTVRLVPPGSPLDPMLLKATARGSHAARKHLLLASLPSSQGGAVSSGLPKPIYYSIAPEAGFGSKA